MNKKNCLMAVLAAMMMMSFMPGDKAVTKKGGVTTINTTTLAQKVEGYNGATPVMITIKKGRVEKVEALQNEETPRYMAKVKKAGLLERWNGKKVKDAIKMDVDVVTGATYSSKAIIENVRVGLKAYK